MYKVVLEIFEARNLPAADVTGFSDPYCIVEIKNTKFRYRTAHILQNLNPVWNEQCEFSPVSLSETPLVSITVYDKDEVFRDDIIGRLELSLTNFREGKIYNSWHKLDAKSGEIHLKLELVSIRSKEVEKTVEMTLIDQLGKTKKLFEDPDFPAIDKSLYLDSSKHSPATVSWKRPSEWSQSPRLFVDGVESGDVIQGALGDCYLLGALSVLATRKDLLMPLFVSSHPEFGFYQVKFWKNGEWKIVTVDDRIPYDNQRNKPIYGRCRDKNEIWVPIIEKAYAKLHGCYEAIESGTISVAMTDLTGEGCQVFDFNDKKCVDKVKSGEFWNTLREFSRESFMMGCACITAGPAEQDTGMGVLKNHAYSVLKTEEPLPGVRLLCIRNPWGQLEWKGRYSDNSKEWTPELKKKLGIESTKFEDDGMFWICYEDFVLQYNQLITLRLLTDAVGDQWYKYTITEDWKGRTAGGCTNHPTWVNNTQYWIQSKKPDNKLFITLTQPDARMCWQRNYDIPLGLYVMKTVSKDSQKLTYTEADLVGKTPFTPGREVSLDISLANPKDTLIVIPSTFAPGQETHYWLNIYSMHALEIGAVPKMRELVIKSEWKGPSAGGCYNNKETWTNNPIFVINVDDANLQPTDQITIAATLQQDARPTPYYIGMYTAPYTGQKPSPAAVAKRAKACTNSLSINMDQTFAKADFPIFIMPHTFHPKLEGGFVLRVYCSYPITSKNL